MSRITHPRAGGNNNEPITLTRHVLSASPDDPDRWDPPTQVREVLSALEPLTPATGAELRRVLLDAFEAGDERRELVSQALMSCGLAIEEVR